MKKLLLTLFLLFVMSQVFADQFVHEGDHNYSIISVAMTTAPHNDAYLVLNFKLLDENNNPGKNTHVHLRTFDDRNAIIHDYSIRLTTSELIGSENKGAIDRSEGYEFFRILQQEDRVLENRLVSDDNGSVSVQLFLNSCGVNQSKECYFQTGKYRIEISQSGLKQNEYFNVTAPKVYSNWVFQLTSFLAENFVALVFIMLIGFILFIVIVFILKILINKIKEGLF